MLLTLLLFAGGAAAFPETPKNLLPHLVVQSNYLIKALAISSDGRLIATGSLDNPSVINLWDAATGLQVRTINPGSYIEEMDFSPDGNVLVSLDASGQIKFWNVRTGEAQKTLKERDVDAIAFSPKDWILAVSYTDGKVKLFDIARQSFLPTVYQRTAVTNDQPLAFSPDGQRLAIAGGRQITVYSLKDKSIPIKLRTPKGVAYTVAFSPDGKKILSKLYADSWGEKPPAERWLAVWDLSGGNPLLVRGEIEEPSRCVLFTPDSKEVFGVGDNGEFRFWSATTGNPVTKTLLSGDVGTEFVLSADGSRLVSTASGSATIRIWDMKANKEIRVPSQKNNLVWSLAFSPDSKTLAVGQNDSAIRLWDLKGSRGSQLWKQFDSDYDEHKFHALVFADLGSALIGAEGHLGNIKLFSLDGDTEISINGGCSQPQTLVAVGGGAREACVVDWLGLTAEGPRLEVWDIGSRFVVFRERAFGDETVALSPDGQALAVWRDDAEKEGFVAELKIIDLKTQREKTVFREHMSKQEWEKRGNTDVVAFGPRQMLALGYSKGAIEIIDIANNKSEIFSGHEVWVEALAFSPDGKLLASGGWDGQIKLWDMAKRQEICTLISLDKDQWVVVSPQGGFDTNQELDSTEELHWVMSDEPMRALPLEIFMRPYYEPRLLPRLLANEDFARIPVLADLNRLQPKVTITGVGNDGPGTASVIVEVESVERTYQREQNPTVISGAKDLRLFRNGQLVGYRDGNLLGQKQTAATGCEPIESSAKKCRAVFEHIRLPQQEEVDNVEFSAYAFNTSDIKSETFRFPFEFTPDLPPKKGRVYLITVGVSQYQNPDWNLEFAANDAHLIDDTVAAKLRATEDYGAVVNLMLTSEERVVNGQREIVKTATKENFRKIMRLLAGEKLPESETKEIPHAREIEKATPEDVVLIFYSSHGYRDEERFYLFPYDTGPGRGIDPEAVAPHAISSDDLYRWLRDVDAGDVVLVIDACHAAAVTGKEFKPGPMGSRGMGQLAYDKGMRILAATQPDTTAAEVDNLNQNRKIQHGLLTFALVEDGLIDRQADINGDRAILLSEWLAYGVADVPKLFEEAIKSQTAGAMPTTAPVIKRGSNQARFISKGDGDPSTQQPSLFDFTEKIKRKRQLTVERFR